VLKKSVPAQRTTVVVHTHGIIPILGMQTNLQSKRMERKRLSLLGEP